MKILLTSNVLIPEVAAQLGVTPASSGGWIQASTESLRRYTSDITLGIVTTHPELARRGYTHNDVTHYVIQNDVRSMTRPPHRRFITAMRDIINDFQPDVIHVNGSEYSYGMAVKMARPDIPALLSIQGISFIWRNVHQRVLPLKKRLRYDTLRDHASVFVMRKQEVMEKDTISMFSNICGRTEWDKAHVKALNPNATYYSVNRLLRSEFWDVQWNPEQKKRHTIFSNSGGKALKGIHTLLEAIAYLKEDYPEVEARIPGMDFITKKVSRLSMRNKGYVNYLFDLINKWDLKNHVCGLGVLNAQEMADELAKAHVFAQVAHIENSPNSLSEAMLVGTPSVASYCGGTGSIVKDQSEGLMYPAGDAALLAGHLRSLFENDGQCKKFSENARLRAISRNNEESVVQNMLSTYRKVIDQTRRNHD